VVFYLEVKGMQPSLHGLNSLGSELYALDHGLFDLFQARMSEGSKIV
jgi:hypothetical protein